MTTKSIATEFLLIIGCSFLALLLIFALILISTFLYSRIIASKRLLRAFEDKIVLFKRMRFYPFLVRRWKIIEYNEAFIFAGTPWGTILLFRHDGRMLGELYPPHGFQYFKIVNDRLVFERNGSEASYDIWSCIDIDTHGKAELPICTEQIIRINESEGQFCDLLVVIQTSKGKRLLDPFNTFAGALGHMLYYLFMGIVICVDLIMLGL